MRPLCVFHAHCPDGFTAAWLVWHAHRGEIDLHPGVYQEDPPDAAGREVIIVDFSYPPEQLARLADNAAGVLVLDHHQTAVKALNSFDHPNVEIVLDEDRSGAGLAWRQYKGVLAGMHDADWIFRAQQLAAHIEDRDLWRNLFDQTPLVFAAATSFPYTIEAWDELHAYNEAELLEIGRVVERYRRRLIDNVVGYARMGDIGGHLVPIVNCAYEIAADAADRLIELHPGTPFAVAYHDQQAVRYCSLRSADDGADVAKIAELFGGGGHRHAAAFRAQLTHDA